MKHGSLPGISLGHRDEFSAEINTSFYVKSLMAIQKLQRESSKNRKERINKTKNQLYFVAKDMRKSLPEPDFDQMTKN